MRRVTRPGNSTEFSRTDLCADTGQTRIIKKVVPSESFFSFFSPPSLDDDNEEEDEEGEAIEAKLELDYQIGEDLKERVSFLRS